MDVVYVGVVSLTSARDLVEFVLVIPMAAGLYALFESLVFRHGRLTAFERLWALGGILYVMRHAWPWWAWYKAYLYCVVLSHVIFVLGAAYCWLVRLMAKRRISEVPGPMWRQRGAIVFVTTYAVVCVVDWVLFLWIPEWFVP